jgi:adenine-specific DNA-methyltransferase
MCGSFVAVNIYQLAEKPRWGGGAEERGAVVLAEGYRRGTCENYFRGIWPINSGEISQYPCELQAYRDLISASRPLGDIASIGIGAVTGCNSTFLLTEEERISLDLSLDPTWTAGRDFAIENGRNAGG